MSSPHPEQATATAGENNTAGRASNTAGRASNEASARSAPGAGENAAVFDENASPTGGSATGADENAGSSSAGQNPPTPEGTPPPPGHDAPAPGHNTTPAGTPRLRSWAVAAAVTAVVTAALSVLLIAFEWPTTSSAPHGVPVAVAPAAAAPAVQARLGAGPAAGMLDVIPVADESAARQAIADQSAVGAIILGPAGPTVLKATMASPVGANVMDRVATMLASAEGRPAAPTAVDVAAPMVGDPSGAGFSTALVPLTIAGLIAAALMVLRVAPMAPRLTGTLAASVAAGLAFAGLLHGFGVLAGSYWAEAAVIALIVGAVAFFAVGMVSMTGVAGIGVAAVIMVVLGMPLAGIATGPHVLPAFWGAVGQWLPAGAGGTLLRRVSFFPDAALGAAPWILIGWVVLGLVLAAVGRARLARTRAHTASRASSAIEA